MLTLCDTHGLLRPERNVWVVGYEVDFLWREVGLIVETDGFAAHGTRKAFERDRIRDAEHTAAGWRVLRVTHRRLTGEPRAVAAQIRRLLDGGR